MTQYRVVSGLLRTNPVFRFVQALRITETSLKSRVIYNRNNPRQLSLKQMQDTTGRWLIEYATSFQGGKSEMMVQLYSYLTRQRWRDEGMSVYTHNRPPVQERIFVEGAALVPRIFHSASVLATGKQIEEFLAVRETNPIATLYNQQPYGDKTLNINKPLAQ